MHLVQCQEWERSIRHNRSYDALLCSVDQAICDAQQAEAVMTAAVIAEVGLTVVAVIPTGGSDLEVAAAALPPTIENRASIQQRLAALAQAVSARLGRSTSNAGEYDDLAPATGRWQRGMNINTRISGRDPAWSTVRARYWKNRAMDPDAASFGEVNLERMNRGLAPQRGNRLAPGGTETLELSHEPIPQRAGGTAFVERWPCDHALHDDFRHPGYC